MAKLFSHHDPNHLHKGLGLFALLHYIYRFTRYVMTGSMGFEEQPLLNVVICLGLHILLSVSSLIFPLPGNRIKTERPMIWPEFRAHNILFALRPLLAIIGYKCINSYQQQQEELGEVNELFISQLKTIVGFGAVIGTLLGSDVITAHFTKLNASGEKTRTMRGMPYPKETKEETRKAIKLYHAACQFTATACTLIDMDLAFFTVMPVQISAFLMTLVRKGLITSKTWHVIYIVLLAAPFVLTSITLAKNVTVMPYFTVTSLSGQILRCRYNWNKFLVWGIILGFALFWRFTFRLDNWRPTTDFEHALSFTVMAVYISFIFWDLTQLYGHISVLPLDKSVQEIKKRKEERLQTEETKANPKMEKRDPIATSGLKIFSRTVEQIRI